MVLFPDLYCEDVPSIPIDKLLENGIQGLVFDVDNTLIDYERVLGDGVVEWVEDAKNKGLKMCILSNSNKVDKISKVANTLKVDYILSAKKPLKSGFEKAIENLSIQAKHLAVIGDQVFTDVWGANRMNMFSVYVKPISKKEHWYTRIKRPFEALVLYLRPNKND